MYDYLIVGAGFSGCVLAERIATQLGLRVLIVDRRNHIGGNAFDYYDDHGILVHKYGPHIFHTNAQRVWDYLGRFTAWRIYEHKVVAVVDGKEIPVPFNLNSLAKVFPSHTAAALEEQLVGQYGYGAKIPILTLRHNAYGDLKFLADFIYDNVFHGYTTKQWGMKPEDLDASVTSRVPVFVSHDDRYFQDEWQGIPQHGYTRMFQNMIAHPNIQVLLNADYRAVADIIPFKKMIYTGPIDEFFDYAHGELPYRSLRFELQTQESATPVQSVAQVNFPNEHDYTRTTEFRLLTGQNSAVTTVSVEYPQPYIIGQNEPYYPIPRQENNDLFKKYRGEAEKLVSVVFAGRLADYRYYNMDQVVARALAVFGSEIAP